MNLFAAIVLALTTTTEAGALVVRCELTRESAVNSTEYIVWGKITQRADAKTCGSSGEPDKLLFPSHVVVKVIASDKGDLSGEIRIRTSDNRVLDPSCPVPEYAKTWYRRSLVGSIGETNLWGLNRDESGELYLVSGCIIEGLRMLPDMPER